MENPDGPDLYESMKRDKEKGSVLLIVLFVSTLIMMQLTGSIAFLANARSMMVNDLKSLQAKSYAEAGIWLAIEHWEETEPKAALSATFSFQNGSAHVTLSGTDQLEIRSEGRVPPFYVDRLSVSYDPITQKVITWKRVVGW